MLAAQLSITNKLVEGTYSGNLGDLLGKDYTGYNWTMEIEEERTNKLFDVDIAVAKRRRATARCISRSQPAAVPPAIRPPAASTAATLSSDENSVDRWQFDR